MIRVKFPWFKTWVIIALPFKEILSRDLRVRRSLRTKIDTGCLDRREEDQDSWSKEISWFAGSISFGRQAIEVHMMPCSQGREGNTFREWKLQGRDELQSKARDVMHSIGQRRGTWVYEDQCRYPRHDRAREGPLQKSKNVPR
jgi:hypothetical protein